MAYIGVSPSNGVRKKHTYTATASQTSFSGAGDEGITLAYRDSNYVDVYQNGVKLADEDYTATSGTAIVLAQGASADDIVEIIAFDVFSVADTVSKADGGTFDGNVTMAGTLGVTGVLTGTSLDISGDIDIDGITNLDIVDIDGAVNFAADVTFADGADIITASAGTSNFRVGVNAGNSIESGGNYNVVVGDEAGTAITTGDSNTAVGYGAGDNITTGSSNIIIGHGIDAPSATASKQINIGNSIHNEVSASNAFGNLDVTMNSTTENVLAISQNTAVALFGGGNSFSGVVIINDINQTGEAGVFISAGGTFKLISQVSNSFVNSSSPNTAQIGYYIASGVMYIKPGRTGTTNFRILSLRTRVSA